MGHSSGSLVRLDKPLCAKRSPAVSGVLLPTQHRQGVVIGSGDRALGCKARVPGLWRTVSSPPRVIAPQNRMHLTRSPRRSKPQPGRTQNKARTLPSRRAAKNQSPGAPTTELTKKTNNNTCKGTPAIWATPPLQIAPRCATKIDKYQGVTLVSFPPFNPSIHAQFDLCHHMDAP